MIVSPDGHPFSATIIRRYVAKVTITAGIHAICFSIFCHLDAFPTNTLADAERWAAGIGGPAYAIDEQTAIKVVDRVVDVILEGH